MTGDDSSTYYSFTPGERVGDKYWTHSQIGKGAYGTVIKAYHYKEGRDVALKFFKTGTFFEEVGMEEATILDLISRFNENSRYPIIKHYGTLTWMDHFCIVYPLYNNNLYYELRKRKAQGFTYEAVRKISTQLLECLFFLQHPKLEVIHADIKPDNILFVNSRSYDIILIDFGNFIHGPKNKINYMVQTVYYRSPEVILKKTLTYSIDMWSFGCVLFELKTGKPLFNESNDFDIMKSIVEVLGVPEVEILHESTKARDWFRLNDDESRVEALVDYNRLPPGYRSIESLLEFYLKEDYEGECPERDLLLDLIKKCVQYNPCERLNPLEALRHPFINSAKEYRYSMLPITESQNIPSGEHRNHQSNSDDRLFYNMGTRENV